jgi:bifunctional DNase/RNase
LADGGRAEGHATASSPGRAEPPAGYVLMRPKAQLEASQGNALLLVDGPEQRVVPIFVGSTEALSIRLRLDGERYSRPLTHDLLDTLLSRLGAKLESVRIDELRANVFIGTVVVRDREGQLLQVDARASDAVALAIGNKAPIFMAQAVLDRAGYRIDELDKKIGAGAASSRQVEPTRL